MATLSTVLVLFVGGACGYHFNPADTTVVIPSWTSEFLCAAPPLCVRIRRWPLRARCALRRCPEWRRRARSAVCSSRLYVHGHGSEVRHGGLAVSHIVWHETNRARGTIHVMIMRAQPLRLVRLRVHVRPDLAHVRHRVLLRR